MKKGKWNYAVVRSVFGDLWIGKTKLPIKKDTIFSDIEEASQMAIMSFEQAHPEFDTVDEDNNDMDLQYEYEKFLYPLEDDKEIDEIKKGIEKFII